MAKTLRVHSLAKELGVPSKAVIEKCCAEGIDLKNHMAAISIGLGESIREWFSTAADVTSIETAEHVDVELVRKERRMTGAATEEAADVPAPSEAVEVSVEDSAAGAVIEAEAPAQVTVAAEPVAEPVTAAEPDTGLAARAPGVETPAEPQPVVEAADTAELVLTAEPVLTDEPPAGEAPEQQVAAVEELSPPLEASAPQEVLPVEPRPEPPALIVPAGPQVVPVPAALKGPTVIRIESPEPQRPLRPRGPRPAMPRGPLTRGPVTRGPGAPPPPATSAPPKRGRGKGRKPGAEEAAKARSKSPRRHGSSTDVDQRLREWRDQDLLERKERLANVTGHGLRDRRAAERRRQAGGGGGPALRSQEVTITAPIVLKEFCSAVGVPFIALSKRLTEHTGRLWTINQSLDAETAELLGIDLGMHLTVERAKTAYERLQQEFDDRERKNLQPRPPVVAMLGHVDHGKTSLLDAIRKTRVTAGEAGGITQHIGACRVKRGGWDVTFVDTPGHKAFTEMRARGANLTDVVVLVVAADDGVMPQTAEAINHAKAAGVAIVVALNKIDLPGVDLNKVYGQLAEHDLAPADWGGHTDLIKTSATANTGIEELLSHLSTLSELMELKADHSVPAQAIVIEAQMRAGRGVVAQVLVREGTLKPGISIVCGPGSGRIRALVDDQGKQVKLALPGTPIEVSGLDQLPASGDRLYQVDSPSQAKEIAREVAAQRRTESLTVVTKPRTLEALVLDSAESEVPDLNVILKADTQGSVEVLKQSLNEFPVNKARLNILHSSVGAVSEADIHLAKASGALAIGFHVIAEDRARQLADQLGVEIRTYRVIYELLDDLHKALAGLLAPLQHEEIRGTVEVRQTFNVSRVGTVAGSYVTDGVINRKHVVRLVRDGRVITEGKTLDSLKRFHDDAREVRAGLECGVKIRGFDDIKPGDIIQAYELIEVAQEL